MSKQCSYHFPPHWDREWYLPLKNTNLRLVDLIDQAPDLFDTDPDYRHFHLMIITLDDYLQNSSPTSALSRPFSPATHWALLRSAGCLLISGEANRS